MLPPIGHFFGPRNFARADRSTYPMQYFCVPPRLLRLTPSPAWQMLSAAPRRQIPRAPRRGRGERAATQAQRAGKAWGRIKGSRTSWRAPPLWRAATGDRCVLRKARPVSCALAARAACENLFNSWRAALVPEGAAMCGACMRLYVCIFVLPRAKGGFAGAKRQRGLGRPRDQPILQPDAAQAAWRCAVSTQPAPPLRRLLSASNFLPWPTQTQQIQTKTTSKGHQTETRILNKCMEQRHICDKECFVKAPQPSMLCCCCHIRCRCHCRCRCCC